MMFVINKNRILQKNFKGRINIAVLAVIKGIL